MADPVRRNGIGGRLSQKARLLSYKNMYEFLGEDKESSLEATYSIFAMSASFAEDVIESKHEAENLELSNFLPEEKAKMEKVMRRIESAPQLVPLTDEEISVILQNLKEFHGRAYGWSPELDMHDVLNRVNRRGHLLRTRIRTAVEILDQLYQCGEVGQIKINSLGQATFEQDPPLLDELLV